MHTLCIPAQITPRLPKLPQEINVRFLLPRIVIGQVQQLPFQQE